MGLEHFAASASADEVLVALQRDGACIVDDVLDAAALAVIRRELDAPLAATSPGVEEFSGLNTRRFGSLIERAPSTRALVMHPLVLEVTGKLLSHATTVPAASNPGDLHRAEQSGTGDPPRPVGL